MGESNNVAPLFVDGAVTYFAELPKPEAKDKIQEVYNFINKTITVNTNKTFFMWTKKILKNG